MKIAEKHNLCFKRSKCDVNIEEIPILGVIVGKRQVQIEQDKVKTVKEWKTPMKIKEVESFLGFVNFYQRFIQNFSHTAKPLNDLKGKKKEEMEMGRRTSTGFPGVKKQDYKSTGTLSSKKKRKIQSRNRHLRTHYWRIIISRTGRKMETNSFFI